jgi:predicted transcriptional regulator
MVRKQRQGERAELEQTICERLSGDFGGAVSLFNAALADGLGMHPTDFRCVALLAQTGALRAGQIAQQLGMSTAATTLMLDRIERARLIRRAEDPADRRRVIIQAVANPQLTKALEAKLGQLAVKMSEVCSHYDAAQLGAIAEFLGHTADVLRNVASTLRK